MQELTRFQRLELILIPVSFIFGQIMIFLFGISIIGQQMVIVMGIPMILGLLAAVILNFLLLQRIVLITFFQMEHIFRILTVIGGMLLLFIISLQILLDATSLDIIPLMALIISTIGDMMSIMCLISLKNHLLQRNLQNNSGIHN